MKTDIRNRADLELLINAFYHKVKSDQVIGFYFSEVVNVNWDSHLPKMYDFWENILFYRGVYSGNPMEKHVQIHQKQPMNQKHFNQWTMLFTETVDELFEGEKAETIKQRAISIATVMLIKVIS